MSVTLSIDTSAGLKIARRLADVAGGMDKVQMRAINRTLPLVEREEIKAITSRYTLKASDARAGLTRINATTSRVEGRVRARGKPLSLRRYKARANRMGVRVQVLRGGGGKLIRGAFIAQLGKQDDWREHVAIRRRAGQGRVGRLPIDVLRGPSLTAMARVSSAAIHDEIMRRYQERLKHEADFLLRGRR